MKYSVIIPAYNCAGTICETAESIFSSGLRDFEIILVDDGSTDDTYSLCRELNRQHENARCIHQNNTGVSGARNAGIEAAKGKYILFVDSDDTLAPDCMTEPMRILDENEPDLLFFGMSVDFYHKGKNYRRDVLCYSESGSLDQARWREAFPQLYRSNSFSSSCNKFFLREKLIQNSLRFRLSVFAMEDFLFVTDYLRYCDTLWSYPQPIYHYRQTEKEDNTVNRLARIEQLSEYMKPFEESLSALKIPCEREIADSVYFAFLSQRISSSALRQIRFDLEDCLNSRYALEVRRLAENEENRHGLYRMIARRRVLGLRWRAIRKRVRHRVGIFYRAWKAKVQKTDE